METVVFRSDSRYLYETDVTGRRITKPDWRAIYFLVYGHKTDKYLTIIRMYNICFIVRQTSFL